MGRPKGRKSSYYKLTGKEKVIKELLDKGLSKTQVAKILNVHRNTLSAYMKKADIKNSK